LALLRITANQSEFAGQLWELERTVEFTHLCKWCDSRGGRFGEEWLLVVPARRLARFLRGMKELSLKSIIPAGEFEKD
jgi:hypothetical protein